MDRCKEIEEQFRELLRERSYSRIGELFTRAKGFELKCLEAAVINTVKDLSALKEELRNILSAVSGKERAPSGEIVEKIINSAIATYFIEGHQKGYPVHMVIVRFNDGKQRNLKSLRSRERALEVYGVLKIYTLLNKYGMT